MMKMFLSSMIFSMSLIMITLNHPLSMGFLILLQTLLTCLLSGMLIKTYWFSYILFLTFLGGLLVLFIYVSSIASNEMFLISYKTKLILLFIFFFLFIISIYQSNNLNWMNMFFNEEMNNLSFNMFNFFNNENKINLSKLYNSQTFLIMILLVNYLFITLIAVVKITKMFFGPLRSNLK